MTTNVGTKINGENKTSHIVNLGGDVKSTITSNGTTVAKFTGCANIIRRGMDLSEWINFVAFGDIAKTLAKYGYKGRMVRIIGRMKTDTFYSDVEVELDDGSKVIGKTRKTKTVVIVEEFIMLGRKDEHNKTKEDTDNITF